MPLSHPNTSEEEDLIAKKIWFDEFKINVEVMDGRIVSVPIDFYPSLANATTEEREDFRFFCHGTAVHFNALDIDLSIESLIYGRKELSPMAGLKRDSLVIKNK